MRIVIAGGTGFLGRALAAALAADRHELVILTRRPGTPRAGVARFVSWKPDGGTGSFARAIDGASAVVNLAGESIAGRRWSPARKRRILESRRDATRSRAAAIAAAGQPPAVFLSASAVGYYGPHGDERLDETAPAGSDFLAEVCVQWEAEAHRVASARTRVVCLRTGLVLARDGGALPRMLLPFRLFAGGRIGDGRQYWPWIHRDDWVGLVRYALERPAIAGAINLTAPDPVVNAEFARALGRALRRPALLPAPAFALRLMLGEMAEALLLSGQRAVPVKAQREGYRFAYERVDEALGAIFARGPQA
ncbi:MAG: TIGR01777 family oxidoreductase [Acidobacteria bacterium]|nr:TIGR01777 family oxidoreductase [Acidobacteriota bacterium]